MHTTTRGPDLDTTTVETTGSGTDTAPGGTIREEFDIGLEPAWITDDEETSPTGPESSADRRGDRRGHPSGRTGDQHLEPVEGGETEVGPRSGAIARNTYPDEALRWKPGIGIASTPRPSTPTTATHEPIATAAAAATTASE